MDKRHIQLGMNPSTASNRLVKDILFTQVAKESSCHRCGGELTRENFSIEHKEAWLDSDDPIGLFFDMGNIAYSHFKCNSGAARKANRVEDREDYYARKRAKNAADMRNKYTPETRRAKYVAKGH